MPDRPQSNPQIGNPIKLSKSIPLPPLPHRCSLWQAPGEFCSSKPLLAWFKSNFIYGIMSSIMPFLFSIPPPLNFIHLWILQCLVFRTVLFYVYVKQFKGDKCVTLPKWIKQMLSSVFFYVKRFKLATFFPVAICSHYVAMEIILYIYILFQVVTYVNEECTH